MMMQSNNKSNEKKDLVKFKVFFFVEEEKKRPRSKIITLSQQSLSFSHLEAQIVDHFEVKHGQRVMVNYQDEEDDQVTISSDEELQAAICTFANKSTVCLHVSLWSNCTSSSPTPVESTEEERMNSVLVELEAMGFSNRRLNIKLLKKHSGDVNKVSQVLAERSCKRQERIMLRKKTHCSSSVVQAETSKSQCEVIKPPPEINQEESEGKCESVTTIPDVNHVASNEPEVGELEAINLPEAVNQTPTEVPELVVETQPEANGESSSLTKAIPASSQESMLGELEGKGFTNKKQNIRLLKKHGGNVKEVIQVLTERSSKRRERSRLKETDELHFGALLSELKAKGFSQKRLNIKLLKKNDQDIDKVIQELTEVGARRQEKRIKRTRCLQHHEEPDEMLRECISELEAKGFCKKRLNVRLIKQHDLDVGKVLQILGNRADRLALKRVKHQPKNEATINQAAWDAQSWGLDNKNGPIFLYLSKSLFIWLLTPIFLFFS